MTDVRERVQIDAERRTYHWFVQGLDKVDAAIRRTRDLDQAVGGVLEAALSIFACDQAWLIHPCDPDAVSWQVPEERSRPGFRGGFAADGDLPVTPDMATLLSALRGASGPVRFGTEADERPLTELTHHLEVQSMMAMAIYPRSEQPYAFGLHHSCTRRVWAPEELRLFEEIGRRLTDVVTALSMLRRQQESESRLNEVQRMAKIGYWDRDLVFERVTLSNEARRIFGLAAQEPADELENWQKRWQELIHPEDRHATAAAATAALQGGPRYDLEYRVVRPNGDVRMIYSRGDVTWDEEGRPRRMFGFMQDVTEHKLAEQQLFEINERFRLLAESSLAGIYLIQDSLFRYVNPALAQVFGYEVEEVTDKLGPVDLTYPPDRPIVAENVRRRVHGEAEEIRYDFRGLRKDGQMIFVEVHGRRIEHGGKVGVIGTLLDITERKRAERALMESHSLLNAVVEGTVDAVFVKDLEGRYLKINSAGARMLGACVEDVIGRSDERLFSPATAAAIMGRDRHVMDTLESQTFEEEVTVGDMTRTFLTTKSVYRGERDKVIGLIGISHDITELKRLEEQFRQSQKMEAVGRLAGGVAHDFNNLLTVINAYSEMAHAELDSEHPGCELLVEIRKAGERAATLTRQLLAFSRRQVLRPEVLDLNTLLEDVQKLLGRLIGEDLELILTPDPGLDLVKVDRGQFEQAIVNLAVNARDAMPRGGHLVIETHNIVLDAEYAARHADVRAGRYVLVSVRDSGQGMAPDTIARIFEPFFTTKPPGKGTGLGLAMVYGFVKQSGGHIEVHSEPGEGTTFELYVPSTRQTPRSSSHPSDAAGVRGGSETVLLVEDEDAVRNLSKIVLESKGYTVLEARNGREALESAQRHAASIEILVTDLVMPRMGGRELASMLRTERPGLRIVFMSGYADEAALPCGFETNAAFLHKPFSPTSLAKKVREVLDAKESARPHTEGSTE